MGRPVRAMTSLVAQQERDILEEAIHAGRERHRIVPSRPAHFRTEFALSDNGPELHPRKTLSHRACGDRSVLTVPRVWPLNRDFGGREYMHFSLLGR